MFKIQKSFSIFFKEDAKTPSKREAKTKLKEMKARRRWSNIELAELQQQQLQQQQDTCDESGKIYFRHL